MAAGLLRKRQAACTCSLTAVLHEDLLRISKCMDIESRNSGWVMYMVIHTVCGLAYHIVGDREGNRNTFSFSSTWGGKGVCVCVKRSNIKTQVSKTTPKLVYLALRQPTQGRQ